MTQQSCISSDFKAQPYWWEAAPPTATPSHPAPESADVVIVGGGYTGLSTGLELARAGSKVAVMDRMPIGAGASSRNGGSVGGGLKLAGFALEKRLGQQRATDIINEAMSSLDVLQDLISREAIDCHFKRTGRYIAAWSRRDLDGLKRRCDALLASGYEGTEVLDRAEQRREIGSDRYHGGMLVPTGAQIHPGLYVAGLAKAAASLGATLAGQTDVLAVNRAANGFIVFWRAADGTTGQTRAKTVAIATNGYTGPLTPWLRRRLIPVNSYMIATERLPDGLRETLDPNGRAFSDTKRLLSYFRMAPDDNRAMIGGRVSLGEIDERTAAARLHRELTEIWPELADVKVSHGWKGRVAFTFDYLPRIGQTGGLHYAVGLQGSGVAMGTYLGTRLAARILGSPEGDTAFALDHFPTRPLYSGDPWFLPMVGLGYRALDCFDRRFR